MKINKKIEPARVLVHPAWVLSLGVLILNDHFLKGSGILPGWVTGKLSDLAGLIVAPVLLAALVRARTRRSIAIVHVVVGVGFTAFELSPSLTAAANWVYGLAGFHWHSTRDLTDLLALAVLPLAYLLTVRAGLGDWGRAGKTTARILATAGLLACTASTGQWVEQTPPCGGDGVDCDYDGYTPPDDCNDANSTLYPGYGCPAVDGEDVCDDGFDNDGDGAIDCNDPDCDLACGAIESVCTGFQQYHFDEVTSLTGSTLSGTSVFEGTCLGADSPEVVFTGESPAGTLTFTAPPGHGIHVRTACAAGYTEIACFEGTEVGGDPVEIDMAEYSALTVVVEAIDPFQAADFEVPVMFSPLGCGNGTVENLEQCDDGNHTNGDGCNYACMAELDVLCAAMPTVAIGQTPGSFPGTSTVFYGDCAGSIGQPELGYHYTAASTSVTVTVTSTADLALYATLSCGDLAPSLGCADAIFGSGMETLTLATQPGDELTFYVELGFGQPEDSNFTLEVAEP